MGQVKVINWVTLDGVMQGPGTAQEDTRDGFEAGGWAAPYGLGDPLIAERMGAAMGGDFAWLFGRWTYAEDLMPSWEAQGGPFWDGLRETPKYVTSRDAATTLAWPNSTLLAGDAARTVADLKARTDATLVIMGSGELIGALTGMIDEYLLLIAPVVLGTGRRLFARGTAATLRLTDAQATDAGALLATYRAA